MPLNEGLMAPDLRLPLGAGGEVSLAALHGKKVVVYFYPKDNTPGCTTEAIEFNALKSEFDGAGVTVVGVSPDPVASHQKFAAKHGLEFALAADPELQVLQAWGVWVEKSMYGKKYMGVERTTVLIGADGRIVRIWHKVKPAGHAAEVLEAARAA